MLTIHCNVTDNNATVLRAFLCDKNLSVLVAEVAVRCLSSYQLRNFGKFLTADSLRHTDVLITLIRRLFQADDQNEDDWGKDATRSPVAPMNPFLRKDLTQILINAISSFPDCQSFDSFITQRIRVFGYKAACPLSEIVRRFGTENQAFGSLDLLTEDIVSEIRASAAICPADTLKYLIGYALRNNESMSVVARLICTELRVMAMSRADDWEENLIVSVITQSLMFTPGSQVPDQVVKLVTMIQNESIESPVILTEDLLIDWIDGVRDLNDMSHLTRAVILLMERKSDPESWDRIDVVSLCKFLMDCILDLCDDSVTKERLLDAITVIMRSVTACDNQSHVHRKLTFDELEELRLAYRNSVNLLPICYFQPFTDVDIVQFLHSEELESVEFMLMAAMLDRQDMHLLFPNPGYPAASLSGVLPFLTPVEFGRLFRYLIHFYEPTGIICSALRTLRHMKNEPDKSLHPSNWTAVIRSFEHVFRNDYECGKKDQMLRNDESADPVALDDDGSVEDGYNCFDELETSSRSGRSSRNWKPRHTPVKATVVPRNPDESYSLFHVMYLMLQLEYSFYPNPEHLTFKSMIVDLVTATSGFSDWNEPVPPITRHFITKKNLWHKLSPQQREYLTELDPKLKQ